MNYKLDDANKNIYNIQAKPKTEQKMKLEQLYKVGSE